ncbi:glutaredoxin-like protein NrdH [Vibrio europaeus]|uniref:Glutaredoxin-like protein NrdH n=1 Tax=Vibrio europaeus TaxID=300876 RepID=A0A178JFC0_9VIBR|nr:glutaredoxin-like protein NrdH [Vibrio europaeus]MDC5707257.1 glutaredoxin-like protein NrdH [Vibrio europaeus]MDC5712622.1 glutaredoxin-like protein NrdH [Vibrio europaeus]MDC5717265.1 glutaredoxin-like protein NrdH [Vibrio europaeus]MDC5721201.1 glutaredoxin-like protein NrdH [Vibrio europaeus]MDC5726565.1 glutaredoxin-like protein NrdH [Vibrio europaeus]
MDIIVYSKPQCVQCTATVRALQAKGIDHKVVDLTLDDSAMESVQSMGYRQAPVVVAGARHWSGFRPDMISQLA